jgi:hypothetical protein
LSSFSPKSKDCMTDELNLPDPNYSYKRFLAVSTFRIEPYYHYFASLRDLISVFMISVEY